MYKRQDKPTLLNWLADFETKPRQVVLVHGESREMLPLKDNIEETFGIDVMIPRYGDELEFLGDETHHSTSIPVSYTHLDVYKRQISIPMPTNNSIL